MVTKYNTSDHKQILDAWLVKWNIPKSDDRLLSDYGLVIDDCVIGFLYATPSKQFYIDRVIADPDSGKQKRDNALDILFSELEKTAKDSGAVVITVLANKQSMRNRFIDRSYINFGEYGLYYKELEGI